MVQSLAVEDCIQSEEELANRGSSRRLTQDVLRVLFEGVLNQLRTLGSLEDKSLKAIKMVTVSLLCFIRLLARIRKLL